MTRSLSCLPTSPLLEMPSSRLERLLQMVGKPGARSRQILILQVDCGKY